MPRVSAYLALQVRPRLREIRGARRLQAMNELTRTPSHPKGVAVATLSQLEHGHRLPRPNEMDLLERAYGPRDRWYGVELQVIG